MKNFKELIQRVVLALFRKMACHTQVPCASQKGQTFMAIKIDKF